MVCMVWGGVVWGGVVWCGVVWGGVVGLEEGRERSEYITRRNNNKKKTQVTLSPERYKLYICCPS